MISAKRIADLYPSSATSVDIEVVAETGSTNTDLMNRIGSLKEPTLLVATLQTQGRGRAGRTWLSAAGSSLTFSLAWKFQQQVQALAGLPLAVGLAISQALATYDVRTTLKWPNDLLINEGKLGGVLIETSAVDGGVWAVIGIGLNLSLPGSLEAKIAQPVADARWLAQLDRNQLIAVLLNSLTDALKKFERDGFVSFIDNWNHLHAHAGKPVSIVDGNQVLFEGVAIGVDSLRRLLLDSASGRVAIASGDVSLRTI